MSKTMRGISISLTFLMLLAMLVSTASIAAERHRIAVFSGPRATIQSSPPLVTSNKARQKYGLPLIEPSELDLAGFDHLVPQRLAKPVEVLIEAYTAHPLEKDASELYAPADGYVDTDGIFSKERKSSGDTPVYKVMLEPGDGLYLLPYMARQADGSAWNDDCATNRAPSAKCRQPFFPDASRVFEEIDRGLYGVDGDGLANVLSSRADFDFIRALPSGGYKKGLSAADRTDKGDGDIPVETLGEDMFVYKPFHLGNFTRFHDLARASNAVQKTLDSGEYSGGIWFEASPSIEETIYWLNIITDTELPIVGVAAQRTQRTLSADGPANILDSVNYILSGKWAGVDGKDDLGAVIIEAERIIAGRQVQKSDARPGGYIATGDHGGVLGSIGVPGSVVIYFKPLTLHTWKSQLNLRNLPNSVTGVLGSDGYLESTRVRVKDSSGLLIGNTMPRVSVVKMSHFSQSTSSQMAKPSADILLQVAEKLISSPLAGFVAEGETPYGNMTTEQTKALEIAVYSGMPVVSVGRGNAGGPTALRPYNVFIEGNNLTAPKARLLLMACMMKFGSMPTAKIPTKPSDSERQAVQDLVSKYQEIFDTH
jgi:L-asparaginase